MLSTLINQCIEGVLAYDLNNTMHYVRALDGRYLQINIKTTGAVQPAHTHTLGVTQTFDDSLTFYVCFSKDETPSIRLETNPLAVADLRPAIRIEGSYTAFLKLIMAGNTHTISSQELCISADTETLLLFNEWQSSLNIEWAALLCATMGDTLGIPLAKLCGTLSHIGSGFIKNMRHNLAEYLVEDSELLAPTPVLKPFLNQIDQLRADIERLQQKMDQAIQAKGSKARA